MSIQTILQELRIARKVETEWIATLDHLTEIGVPAANESRKNAFSNMVKAGTFRKKLENDLVNLTEAAHGNND